MNTEKQNRLAILSMVGFIVLWAIVTDAWNYSERLNINPYLYGYFGRIIWMFPAFVLIRKFNEHLFWNGKALFSKPKAEPVFVAFMVLTTLYALALMIIKYNYWHIMSEKLLFVTIKFLIVGIGEEIVFRGWGYNLLKKVYSPKASCIISAFLFVVLHWPAYFIRLFLYGQFNWTGIVSQSTSVFFCGLLFSVLLERSGTIWNPVIAHFYYDWMLEVFS